MTTSRSSLLTAALLLFLSAKALPASRYAAQNALVHDARVVFLGDSITDYWGRRNGHWFPYRGWLNRGIGGQTTTQMLEREDEDVLALKPAAVVLEGGNNDMRLGSTPEAIRDNFLRLAEAAEARHIQIFIAAMTPVCDCFKPVAGLRSVASITKLNRLLAELCQAHGWSFIDLHAPLTDSEGRMQKRFTVDGVHPNDAGYAQIGPVLVRALHQFQ